MTPRTRTLAGCLLLVFSFAYLIGGAIDEATPHLPAKQPQPIVLLKETRAQVHARQSKNLRHAMYVCERGRGPKVRWHCKAAHGWLKREWEESRPPWRVPYPWYSLAGCESGRQWDYNGSSGFDGGLQFHPGTWSAYRPSSFPDYAYQATPWQQVYVAKRVLAVQGWGAWPDCSRKLGLR